MNDDFDLLAGLNRQRLADIPGNHDLELFRNRHRRHTKSLSIANS